MANLYPMPDYRSFINYAHRGASEYAPENTLLSFYTGILMGANGIETDVQRTKDGILVLFHDGSLTRVTGEEGAVADYTYEELRRFSVKKGHLSDKICTLEAFLQNFCHRDLTFAIELKSAGVEEDTAALIRRYSVEEKVVITSFGFQNLCAMRKAAPELKCGFLTSTVTDERLAEMKELGIGEICPKATEITAADTVRWHEMGFNVRAWGVANTEIMLSACEAGVDGMTVNFPDKLTAYITEKWGTKA